MASCGKHLALPSYSSSGNNKTQTHRSPHANIWAIFELSTQMVSIMRLTSSCCGSPRQWFERPMGLPLPCHPSIA